MNRYKPSGSRNSDKTGLFPRWVWVPITIMTVCILGVFVVWWYVTTGSVSNVKIPPLRDVSLQEARETLDEIGLEARIHREPSLQTPKNHIIRQVPSAGETIRDNRMLDLYVSDGPEYTTVPNLRNMTLVSARNKLVQRVSGTGESVGTMLNLGNITRIYSESVEEGSIISQNPRPNRKVIRGTQVDVLVSRGPWPRTTTVPEVRSVRIEKARQRLREAGLEVEELRYDLNPQAPPSVVLEQAPFPGLIVVEGEGVTLTVNLDDPTPPKPSHRYTVLLISPPLTAKTGQLKVIIRDLEKRKIAFKKEIDPGTRVEVPVRIYGRATAYIYWNDSLYDVRQLGNRRYS